MPSASELGPSDAAVAVFGRVLVRVGVAALLGATITVVMMALPVAWGEVSSLVALGLAIGLPYGLGLGIVAGVVVAAAREAIRGSRRAALIWLVGVWLALMALVAGQLIWWLNSLPIPSNIGLWAYVPGALVLGAGLWWAVRDVSSTDDPLTDAEIAELRREELAEARRRRKRGR